MMNNYLTEELMEIEQFEECGDAERFKIKDLDSSNWVFRKLKAIDESNNEIKELAKKEIERIKGWEKKKLEATEGSKNFFEGLLIEYYVNQRKLDEKFKLSTPYGKVSSRKQQPQWNYEDDKTIEWLEKNNNKLIRIKKEVNKAELKKLYTIHKGNVVTKDGEIIEGITIENRADTISIKITE